MSPRRGIRARGERTRGAILAAAEVVFAEKGFVAARMSEVAVRVGIQRASMGYYFKDKRTLYGAVLDDLLGDLLARYEGILAGPGPVAGRILGCIDAWSRHVIERPAVLRITLWELARARPVTVTPLAARVVPIVEALSSAIRSGQRDGVFRDVDPIRFVMVIAGTTAFLILGMVIAADGGVPQLGEANLRAELHTLTRRVLFAN